MEKERVFSQVNTRKVETLLGFVMDLHFDTLTIKRYRTFNPYRKFYTAEVGIMRPVNAPSNRRTNADRNRTKRINKANSLLANEEFESLELLVEALFEIVNDERTLSKLKE